MGTGTICPTWSQTWIVVATPKGTELVNHCDECPDIITGADTLGNPSDCPRRVCAQLLARFRLSLFRPRIKFEFKIKSGRIWKALDPKMRRILCLISSVFISAVGTIRRSCNVRVKFRWLNNRSGWRNLFSIPLECDEITAEIPSYLTTARLAH